jgi:putative membrane protein
LKPRDYEPNKNKKMRTKLFIGILSCGLLLNTACNQGTDDPVEQARDINQDREQVENKDSKVLTDAASTSMLSNELSMIAQERAVTPEVKEFASNMTQGHTEEKQDLEGVAQRKQIALPLQMSDDHRDKVENVSEQTGIDFDKEYIDEIISVHKDKINDFENLSRDSDDPEIREYAINTLPSLRMHLERAERIEEQLNQRDDARSDDRRMQSEEEYDTEGQPGNQQRRGEGI